MTRLPRPAGHVSSWGRARERIGCLEDDTQRGDISTAYCHVTGLPCSRPQSSRSRCPAAAPRLPRRSRRLSTASTPTSFRFNVVLSGVPDPDNDVRFRIASDDLAFSGTDMEQIEVNFRSPSGVIDAGPLVNSFGSPPDRWQNGAIADFTLTPLGGAPGASRVASPTAPTPSFPETRSRKQR